MIFIPPGEYSVGTDEKEPESLGKEFGTREEQIFENARPRHQVKVNGFYIDKYEVTNEKYNSFVKQTGIQPPPTWENNGMYYDGRENHPVTSVSWYFASDYCQWAGKRLPTEIEWEISARGSKENIYPWGNVFDKNKANLDLQDTLPVGSMPEDKSFFDIYDMGGNVSEWTDSWYKPYPGAKMESKYFGELYKVVKGGTGSLVGHYNLAIFDSRSYSRIFYPPDGLGVDVGFRCAK
jgi:formylglycine-generating enzyme required for sulfatase activity